MEISNGDLAKLFLRLIEKIRAASERLDAKKFALPSDEELKKIAEDTEFSEDGTAEVEINGAKYIITKRDNSEKNAVEKEEAANRFYRASNIDVPSSKAVGAGESIIQIKRKIEGQTLDEWWKNADEDEREKMGRNLREGLTADILLGNHSAFGRNGENIIVDRYGNPWRVNNSGAFGGGRKDWKDGMPDEIWTMTGRADKIGLKPVGNAQKYTGGVAIIDVINDIDSTTWNESLEKLPKEDREIIRKRLEQTGRLAIRGERHLACDFTEEFTERVLDNSYTLTRERLQDVLPDQIHIRHEDEDFHPYDVIGKKGDDTPFRRFEEYLNRNNADGLKFVEEWTYEQSEDSWKEGACKAKVIVLKEKGFAVDDKNITVDEIFDEMRKRGYWTGNVPGDNYRENNLRDIIEEYRSDIQQFERDRETFAKSQGFYQIIYETTKTEYTDVQNGTMLVFRTEDENIVKAKKGEEVTTPVGPNESTACGQIVKATDGDKVVVGIRMPIADLRHPFFLPVNENDIQAYKGDENEITADMTHAQRICIGYYKDLIDEDVDESVKLFNKYERRIQNRKANSK